MSGWSRCCLNQPSPADTGGKKEKKKEKEKKKGQKREKKGSGENKHHPQLDLWLPLPPHNSHGHFATGLVFLMLPRRVF